MITGMFVWIAACASPEGVWLFTLGVDPDVPEDCASTVSHNFIDAAEPGEIASDDDSWTSRETTTLSDQAFLG